jgi:hypothetical protein
MPSGGRSPDGFFLYLGLAERFFKWRKQTKKLAN